MACNVADPQSIEAMVSQVVDHWGRIDILMNNAAIQPPGGNADVQPKHWRLMYRVNVHGSFDCARAVAPSMVEQGGGHIINISSAATRGGTPYGGTKRAVEAMAEGLAAELVDDNIVVTALKPVTAIETPGYLFAQVPRDGGGADPNLPPPDSYVEAAVLLAGFDGGELNGQSHDDAEWIGLLADGETQERLRALNPRWWGEIMDSIASKG